MYKKFFPLTYYFYPLLELPPGLHPNGELFNNVMNYEREKNIETLLYVHIPYCQDLCRFCPFHVRVDKDFSVYERYTDALCTDIKRTARTKRGETSNLKAIYFGGGSPSILSPDQLRRIFDTIKEHFVLTEDVEISFEGEPKTLGDPERLALLKSNNVQRISFGLQTYDQKLRDIFNISATLDDINRVTENAKALHFDEINVDMMYNLPGQTLGHIEYDLQKLIEHDFDSVDYYNLHYYAFPPKFIREIKEGSIPPKPSDDMMAALFEQLRYRLLEAGYHNVADQVYSKKAVPCEYFRILWGGGFGEYRAETLAVGSSARGYVDGFTYIKQSNVNKYMDAIESSSETIEKISSRLSNDFNRGAVMFPKFLGINKSHTEALACIPKDLLSGWLDSGLIVESSDAYRVSEKGKIWTDNMTVDLFESSQREVGDKAVIVLTEKAGSRTGGF